MLAMHGYHDVYGVFPRGSNGTTAGVQGGSRASYNWRTLVLPFMEQGVVYDSLNFTSGVFFGTLPGNTVLSGLVISTYLCPSNRVLPFEDSTGFVIRARDCKKAMCIDYVGISGAYPDPTGRTDVLVNANHGYIANTGMLLMNEASSFDRCIDGSSNTLMTAEQSGVVESDDQRPMLLSNNYQGGWTGYAFNDNGAATFGTFKDFRELTVAVWNANAFPKCIALSPGLATIRNAINSTLVFAVNSHQWHPAINISSEHAGGANGALADASVRFLSETMDMKILRGVCSSNDGESISL